MWHVGLFSDSKEILLLKLYDAKYSLFFLHADSLHVLSSFVFSRRFK